MSSSRILEAEIVCIKSVAVPDLGLRLSVGDIEYVEEQAARDSKHLWKAYDNGSVRIRWIPKCQEIRKGRTNPNTLVGVVPSMGKAERRRAKALKNNQNNLDHEIDTEGVLRKAQASASEEIERQMAKLRKDLLQDVRAALKEDSGPSETPDPKLDQDQLVDMIAGKILGALPVGGLSTSSSSVSNREDDTPMFIPEGIVNSEAKAEIKVEAESSDLDNLDDAMAALRAMKKRKKKDV
jgi:hypothetical protein